MLLAMEMQANAEDPALRDLSRATTPVVVVGTQLLGATAASLAASAMRLATSPAQPGQRKFVQHGRGQSTVGIVRAYRAAIGRPRLGLYAALRVATARRSELCFVLGATKPIVKRGVGLLLFSRARHRWHVIGMQTNGVHAPIIVGRASSNARFGVPRAATAVVLAGSGQRSSVLAMSRAANLPVMMYVCGALENGRFATRSAEMVCNDGASVATQILLAIAASRHLRSSHAVELRLAHGPPLIGVDVVACAAVEFENARSGVLAAMTRKLALREGSRRKLRNAVTFLGVSGTWAYGPLATTKLVFQRSAR